MNHTSGLWGERLLLVSVMICFLMACSPPSNPNQTATLPARLPTLTLTPTPTGQLGENEVSTPSPEPGRCAGLKGELEVQILVGPAEAVGLEPVAVGSLPFSTEPAGDTYQVQGGGAITYQQTLEEDWGTYSVSLDMEGSLAGECTGAPANEELIVSVEMSGEQLVEVRAPGLQGDYPWSGTHVLDLNFPLQEGARAEGDGWVFILHLSPQG